MTTLTASQATANFMPKASHVGVNEISGLYGPGTGSMSTSASGFVLLAKFPAGARIIEFIETHQNGATTSPINFGIRSGSSTSISLAALIADATLGAVNRLSVLASVGFDTSRDFSAGETFKYITASKSGGTATASMSIRFTLLYTMDSVTGSTG